MFDLAPSLLRLLLNLIPTRTLRLFQHSWLDSSWLDSQRSSTVDSLLLAAMSVRITCPRAIHLSISLSTSTLPPIHRLGLGWSLSLPFRMHPSFLRRVQSRPVNTSPAYQPVRLPFPSTPRYHHFCLSGTCRSSALELYVTALTNGCGAV